MILLNAVAVDTPGAWTTLPAGVWVPYVEISGAATVKFEWRRTGSAVANYLKDADGNDYAFTASAAPAYSHALPAGEIRAVATGVAGTATACILPFSVNGAKTGYE